jgi:phosphatidylglycerophosphatase A
LARFILGLASAGFVGYCPLASGTAGTVVGVLLFLLYSPFPPLIYLLSTAALFVLAWWVSERAEVLLAQKDSPKIVIDEVVGYLISMALLPPTLTTIIGGFLFFRLFDIIKPPPARAIHRQMEGGLAVVLDDAVAGIYTNILIELAVLWRPEIIFTLDRFLLRTG